MGRGAEPESQRLEPDSPPEARGLKLDQGAPARRPPLDRLGIAFLVLLVVGTAAFALTGAPRAEPARYLTLYAASFALFGAAFWRLRGGLGALDGAALVRFALVTAACLRLATALAPTSLSDDVYRYAWDGERVRHFVNPYRAAPAEMAARGEASEPFLEEMNSAEFISVYPPLAQAVFAWATSWADAWGMQLDRWIRLLLGLLDLLTVWLLLRLLARFGRARELGLLYAWNPLVYWELAGGGHTEAIMLPFLVLAIGQALRRRWLLMGVALGLAALAKTTVLALAPVLGWFLLTRRRPVPGASERIEGTRSRTLADPTRVPWWQEVHRRRERPDSLPRRLLAATGAAVACLAVIAVGYAPFWFESLPANLKGSIDLYFGYFVFDSPLYELARALLGYQEGVTPDVADQVMPVFHLALIAVTAIAAVSVNGRSHRLPGALFAVSLAQLLLSPVFHPWYLVPTLLLGVLARAWSPLLLAALVGVTYLAYDPTVGEVTTTMLWVQFAPFALLLGVDVGRGLLGPVLRRRARRKYRAARPWLPARCRLLDIGAGEGYVAERARRDGHEPVLVDVVDHNRTDLPHHVYDGERLPFESGHFDVGMLAYVLHHCERPDEVVREASRVCRRLVVLESVYESDFDRRLLTWLDHWANWFRGIPIEPLQFDRADRWRSRFEALGLTVVDTRWLGRVVHKHVLFVLDSEEASASVGEAPLGRKNE